MALIDAAYGFADTISEIREIRGQFLPTDNAGCSQQPCGVAGATRFCDTWQIRQERTMNRR